MDTGQIMWVNDTWGWYGSWAGSCECMYLGHGRITWGGMYALGIAA